MIRLREIIVRRPNHAELGISRLRGLLIAIGVLGTIGSSLSVYPHQLAYFNEVAGGPKSGHKHLLHSNLDWGQDLLYLNEWVDKHPGAHPFHLAYYGYFDPRVVGLNGASPLVWRPVSLNEGQVRLDRGWYAISSNFLYGYSGSARDGSGALYYFESSKFPIGSGDMPDVICGQSISVFHLEH